jgi:hypothetical protein
MPKRTSPSGENVITVELRTDLEQELLLSDAERDAIASSVHPIVTIKWNDKKPRRRHGDERHGFALESLTIVSLAGAAGAAFLGGVFGGVAQEVGKDVYTAVKRLLGGIWKRQTDHAYRLQGRAYVVVEVHRIMVAVEVRSSSIVPPVTEADLEVTVATQLQRLSAAYGTPEEFIEMIAPNPERDVIYILKGGDPKWFVIKIPAAQFPP